MSSKFPREAPEPEGKEPQEHHHFVRLHVDVSPGFWWALIVLALTLVFLTQR